MRTLSLAQRRRLLPARGTLSSDPSSPLELARWRALPAFGRSLSFEQRLEALSLRPEQAALLFNPALAPAGDREDPVRNLLALLQRPTPGGGDAAPGAASRRTFHRFVAPLLDHARGALRERLRGTRGEAAAAENALDALLPLLRERLYAVLIRALVLELNIVRLSGDLPGATAPERFEKFLDRLSTPAGQEAFFGRFPVLARFTLVTMENWMGLCTELLSRLQADREAIADIVGRPVSAATLRTIAGTGDRHHGGRSVCILEFVDGAKIVYKPRDLAVEVALQELTRWIEARTNLTFRLPRSFAQPTHAWVEFVANDPCESSGDVAFYFRHLGATLALAHVLSGVDLHSDNLIAHGRHPVIVDGETFFCARGGNLTEWVEEPAGLASIGILPRIARNHGSREFDNSVLGARTGDLVLAQGARLTARDADGLHFAPAEVLAGAVKCRPMFAGRPAEAADHLGVFVEGFSEVYRLFLRERDTPALQAQLERFRGKPVRYVPRPTRSYGELVEACLHPDYCQNAFDVDLLFERLWDVAPACARLHRLVPAEIEQLWNLDVPMFRVQTDSTTLLTPGGCIENYLPRSGYDEVRSRIASLSEEDLRQQAWIIRSSVVPAPGLAYRRGPATPRNLAPEETAAAIGRHIASLATRHRGTGDVTWLDYQHGPTQRIAFAPLRDDLYDGVAGLALFFAALRRAGFREFAELERSALATIATNLRRGTGKLAGGFNGLAGSLFALAGIARLGGDVDVAALGAPLIPALEEAIARDEIFDVMAGSAGTLLSCLAAWQVSGDKAFRHVAEKAAERLIERRSQTSGGWGWICGNMSRVPLTGFAHGAAGVACAFATLHAATGAVQYAEAAEQALAYERAQFDRNLGNWVDLRTEQVLAHGPVRDPNRPRGMIAWCHGASGIGLSRLACRSLPGRDRLDGDIRLALAATLAAEEGQPGADPTLCHGTFGRLGFLARTSALVPDCPQSEKNEACWTLASEALQQTLFNQQGQTPPLGKIGFMRGLAGVGYELLQKASGYKLPEVLLLQAQGLAQAAAAPPNHNR